MGPSKHWTKEEVRWRCACLEFGCVACYFDGNPNTPASMHHIIEANKRLGHRFTLPLCPPHHMPDSSSGKISIHPGRNPAFVAKYHSEMWLLGWLEAKLGFPHAT